MTPEDISELMTLKAYNQKMLASDLGVSEATISLWLSGNRVTTKPVQRLLRQMLEEAREDAKAPAVKSA